MASGVGRSLTSGLKLGRVDQPRSANPLGRRRGDTSYPSVLEAYDRDSDFKRWQAGSQLHQTLGQRWGNLQVPLLLRHLVDDGTARAWQPLTLVRFPGGSSPEGAWTVCWRHRGALLLPVPLGSSIIRLDQSRPKASNHRLIVDLSGSLNATQLENFRAHIGAQFENGATGGTYPDDIASADAITVAFTLVDVNTTTGELFFDLSRPVMRRQINGRLYWQPLPYRPEVPLSWTSATTRYLISSDTFHCNCPDRSGQTIAALGADDASSQRFPRPSAGAPPASGSALVRQQIGSIHRWRALSDRQDQRRECKHIHAVRFASGIPFAEPSDYSAAGALYRAPSVSSGTIERYQGLRDLTLDYVLPALAAVCGLELDPRDTPEAGEIVQRDDGSRLLWLSANQPDNSWCRGGDWWLKRGANELQVFDGAAGIFRSRILDGTTWNPVLRDGDDDAAAATVTPFP